MRTPFWIILAALTALGAPAAAHMDSYRDHDEAFEAAGKAEIRKLADIFAAVKGKLPGEIIGVEIERKHGVWYYEFRTVDAAGRIYEVYVDAKTAEIARIKEK
jgi:uncharacterized membrane protein YkoI